MTAIVGHRSAIEEEHDLDPVHLIVTELFTGEARITPDEAGALPVFAERVHAEACAQRLRATTIEGRPLFEAVEVVTCWRTFAGQTVLHADGRDPATLTDEDLEGLTLGNYVFEASTFDADDALVQARDLADGMVRGIVRRFTRLLDEAGTQ